jgi:predicted amidohydrolase
MKIACLQFSPVLGDIDNNLTRADALLAKANVEDLDLLVLPELAFTGTQVVSSHLYLAFGPRSFNQDSSIELSSTTQ